MESKRITSQYLFFSGIGTNLTNTSTIGHIGFQTDWESQQLYTQANIDAYFTNDTYYIISTRIGIAPYIGNYKDIHTWLILQLNDYIKNNVHQISVLPVIRLFKHNFLVEFGSNFDSNYLINVMIHI